MGLTETLETYELDIVAQCSSCQGKGLYQGMCERDGAAVVCYNCKGSGQQSIKQTFKKFFNRKPDKEIKRVYLTAGSYCISSKDVTTQEGKLIQFSKAGCSYSDWLNGVEPKPIEDLMCPYQHTNQNMQGQSHFAYDLYKEKCTGMNLLGNYIADCKGRQEMVSCWKRYYELKGRTK